MVVLIEDLTWSISVSTPHCRQNDEAKTEDLKHRLCTETEFPFETIHKPQSSNMSSNEAYILHQIHIPFIAYMTHLRPLDPFHFPKVALKALSSNCEKDFPHASISISINTLFSSSKLMASSTLICSHACTVSIQCHGNVLYYILVFLQACNSTFRHISHIPELWALILCIHQAICFPLEAAISAPVGWFTCAGTLTGNTLL